MGIRLLLHSSVIQSRFYYQLDQPPVCLANKLRLYLPKMISGGAAKEWFDRRRSTIRPWAVFVDQRRFSKPKNLGELCKRLVKNVEHFQSNYIFVLLGLILYCIVTSNRSSVVFRLIRMTSCSGATIVLIGSHAGFREIEGGDADDLLMEPV
ncbi:UNVERIFIED_CONTAM: hypothetical protein FKN15_022672 [Acipenser sinensis]